MPPPPPPPRLPGVTKVFVADGDDYAHTLAETMAALLVAMAPNYTHVMAAATASGKNILPRVAALLDSQPISDIAGVEDADTFVRPIYAGNALATVKSSDPIKVITVRAASFDPVPGVGGSASIEAAPAVTLPTHSRFVSAELSKSERPELTGRARHGIGRPRHAERRELQAARPDRRQARRRRRRLARRGRCRLRAERLPGRPDRQDRRPRAVCRDRHLRRHPASRRHEGQQGDRRDQQGRGGADLPGRRLRPGARSVHSPARIAGELEKAG